jgi:hypothetical protein
MIVNGPSILRQARRGAARFNKLAGVGAGWKSEFIEMMQVGASIKSNQLARVGAGWKPEIIEMMQVGASIKSGSPRLDR